MSPTAQQQSPAFTPLIVTLAATGAGAAFWFGYPGLLVLIAGVTLAAWWATPAVFTGKKDSTGRPTPSSPAEQQAMNRYRTWSDLKWKLLFPSTDWLPGWPPRLWWFAGLGLAGVAAALPTPQLGDWWRLADAAAAFILVNQVNASIRRWSAPDDPCPGPTVDVFAGLFRKGQKAVGLTVGAAAASGAIFLGALLLIHRFRWVPFIAPLAPWEVAFGAALTAAAAVIASGIRAESLEQWRTVVRVRGEWEPRWQMLKLDPAPRLVDHTEVGSAQVDTFDAPPASGAMSMLSMASKIIPTIGTGAKVAVLSCPNVDSQGQPMPGTTHPLRFRVVTWPSDEMPTGWDPELPDDVAELLISCAVAWWCDATGYARPAVTGIQRLFQPGPAPTGTVDDADGDEDEEPEDDGRGVTGAWQVDLAFFLGVTYENVRDAGAGAIAEGVQAEVIVDHRGNGALYFGGLTNRGTRFLDPQLEKKLANLSLEDTWTGRWRDILKQGALSPRIEHSTYMEAKLSNDITVYRQAFVVRQGMDPLEFFKLEPKISTAMSAAPFVAVTGFLQSGSGDRDGERHPQGFCIHWSPRPVPPNPDKLAPTEGLAPKWVLSGRMNQAFDAARLDRPEVSAVKCLTDKRSRGHVWEIRLRLYGGVTLADVRGQAQKLRQTLGSEWLRVAEAKDGCVIVAGVNPQNRGVLFARPEAGNREYVTRLDWEQAFSDSKVVGQGGVLPKLTGSSTLPKNTDVQVLDFTLPTGTDKAMVKAAIPKLMTATGNLFVEVRPGVGGADTIRLLVSAEAPLPSGTGVDWAAVDELAADGKLPFATGVEGEPVVFDIKRDPHALVVGASGGGKAQPLTALLPTPVSESSPTGWTANGDLKIGDQVYAADGTTTTIVGFSEVSIEPVYEVHFADGQVVDVGANHLWKVATAAGRARHSGTYKVRRDNRREEYAARAATIRETASRAAAGELATLQSISRMAGYEETALGQTGQFKHLGTTALVTSNKPARVYSGDAIHETLHRIAARAGMVTFRGKTLTVEQVNALNLPGTWVSHRDLAELILGRLSTRHERAAAKTIVRRSNAQAQPGFERRLATVFPVDEVLFMVADRIERLGTRGSWGEAIPLETIVDTKTMAASVHRETAARKELNYAVRLTAPIPGPHANLPIDPYVLGAWLGDGSARHAQITSGSVASCTDRDGVTDQQRMLDAILPHYPKARVLSDHLIGIPGGFRRDLIGLGLIQNKHIPAVYLRSSEEQRLALLQGLMDTDGHIALDGGCEIDLCDKRLADGVLELVRSLGIRVTQRAEPARITEADPDNLGRTRQRQTSIRYRMKFTTDLPVFRLPRKMERLPKMLRATQQWNYITDVRVREAEPMRCIMVDHPEHLYLTNGFIPTHNSVSLQVVVYPALISGAELYVIDPTKAGADFRFAEPYAKAFAATVPEAEAVMKCVYAEVVRRKNLNAQYSVGSYRDLPDEVRPKHIFLVMDEFTSLMQPEPVSKTPSDDPEIETERQGVIEANESRTYIGTMTGKIAREARSAGVTLVLATQKLSAKMLDSIPAAGDLKTNLARMLMGNATYGERMSALKSPEEAPPLGDVVPKGRGLWESTEANAEVIQVWFEPSQATFAEKLSERCAPLSAEEKPNLSLFMRKTQDSSEPAPSVKDPFGSTGPARVEVVKLDEIEFSLADFGIDDEHADEHVDEHAESAAPDVTLIFVDPSVDPAYLTPFEGRGQMVLLPARRTNEVDAHGWWKLDAAMGIIAASHLDVARVLWVGQDLADLDEIGLTYGELVVDVLTDRGYEVEVYPVTPATAASVTAPQPPMPAPGPAPVVPAPRAQVEAPRPARVVAAPKPRPVPVAVAPVVADGFEEPEPVLTPVYADDLFD